MAVALGGGFQDMGGALFPLELASTRQVAIVFPETLSIFFLSVPRIILPYVRHPALHGK